MEEEEEVEVEEEEQEARVPPAGPWLLAFLLGDIFGMHVRAWPCPIQIDSPHVTSPTHPPTHHHHHHHRHHHPQPLAHKTFIRAQARTARNVRLNKSLSPPDSLLENPSKPRRLRKITSVSSPGLVCVRAFFLLLLL